MTCGKLFGELQHILGLEMEKVIDDLRPFIGPSADSPSQQHVLVEVVYCVALGIQTYADVIKVIDAVSVVRMNQFALGRTRLRRMLNAFARSGFMMGLSGVWYYAFIIGIGPPWVNPVCLIISPTYRRFPVPAPPTYYACSADRAWTMLRRTSAYRSGTLSRYWPLGSPCKSDCPKLS